MKKLIALALAVIMVMSLATAAFADSPSTFTISAPKNGHNYVAYQVFKGDLAGGVLSNIVWGNGITTAGQSALQTAYSVSSAAELALKLNTKADAEAFAKAAGQYLQNPTSLTDESNFHDPEARPDDTISYPHYGTEFTDAGYYLVKETGEIPDGEAATNYILHVVGNVALNPKSSVPTVDKKQSTEDGSNYKHDPVDVGMSDHVYYELTGTLPNTLADYAKYEYIFHDTLSKGLTYDEGTVVVKIDGVVVNAESYTVTADKDAETGKTALTVSFADIKSAKNADGAAISVTATSVVKVYYSATLNSDAVVGNPGNPNTVKLEFSNDPTFGGEGTTSETPEHTVVAFTFTIKVDKQDTVDKDRHLEGAEFVLWNEAKNKVVVLGDGNKVVGWAEHYVGDACTEEHDPDVLLGTVVKSNSEGKFEFIGLDAGIYYLEETKAPAGYNKLADPVEVKIIVSYANDLISDMKVDVDSVNVPSVDKEKGEGSIVVRNAAGKVLPETGGMGTTLFYVLGSVLMIGAAVLLVTKRRMNVK